MNDVIYETVVTTVSPQGRANVAPLGVRYAGAQVVLMPFRPSTTLDNIAATGHAVLNVVVDTRVFAGCVTGRKAWPTVAACWSPAMPRMGSGAPNRSAVVVPNSKALATTSGSMA